MPTNIILLDDEVELSNELVSYAQQELEPGSYTLAHFENLEDLTKYLEKLQPITEDAQNYLLVFDLNLEADDSEKAVFDFIKEIKSGNVIRGNSTGRRIPIIVFSHSSHQDDVNMCYESGANMYVTRKDIGEAEDQFVNIIKLYSTFAKPPEVLYQDNEVAA